MSSTSSSETSVSPPVYSIFDIWNGLNRKSPDCGMTIKTIADLAHSGKCGNPNDPMPHLQSYELPPAYEHLGYFCRRSDILHDCGKKCQALVARVRLKKSNSEADSTIEFLDSRLDGVDHEGNSFPKDIPRSSFKVSKWNLDYKKNDRVEATLKHIIAAHNKRVALWLLANTILLVGPGRTTMNDPLNGVADHFFVGIEDEYKSLLENYAEHKLAFISYA